MGKRLSKSGIEWLKNTDGSAGYAWNFYSGCRHKEQGKCPPISCWAEGMAGRFKDHYPNGFAPTFYPEAFLSPLSLKKTARIGVCFMGDLFGDWVDPNQRFLEYYNLIAGKSEFDGSLKGGIFDVISLCPQHTFVFLTKNPAGLQRWGKFPDNCWVGFSATNREMLKAGCRAMREVQARVKFVSVEPMLEDTWCMPSTLTLAGIKWVIIGAQTKPYKPPELSWVKFMVAVAEQAGARVFLKNNLRALIEPLGMIKGEWAAKEWVMCKYPVLRQELPI
jgi:protein gp37